MTQPVVWDERTISAQAAFPLPQYMPRTRREVDPKDAVNARQFEHWQTNGKYMTYNRPDMNQQAPFQDMMPNSSRTNDRDTYRAQPRYDPNTSRGAQNPYFDKYDTASDSRNTVRELRTSVYEDKNTGFLKESEKLLQRNFDHRWMDPTVVQQQAKAAEQLRPKRDDIRMFYQNQPSAAMTAAMKGSNARC